MVLLLLGLGAVVVVFDDGAVALVRDWLDWAMGVGSFPTGAAIWILSLLTVGWRAVRPGVGCAALGLGTVCATCCCCCCCGLIFCTDLAGVVCWYGDWAEVCGVGVVVVGRAAVLCCNCCC